MDSARRWLTQIVGRGEPEASPSPAERSPTFRELQLPDGRRVVVVGSAIPSREAMGRQPADPLVDLFKVKRDRYGYSVRSSPERFVELAEQLVDIEVPPAKHVPFHAYWSTYDDMDLAQRRWYFWWRQELRQGRYLDADLSYVFVHIFELINLIGVAGPEVAFDQLERVDAVYSPIHSSLPYHLDGWIEDFAVVHGLDTRLDLRWAAQLANPRRRHFSARLLDRQIGQGFLRMPLPVIGVLARYETTGTFAHASNAHLLEHFFRLALDAVDTAFRKRTGSGLAERYAPPRYGPPRDDSFTGAVYGGTRIEVARPPDYRYADRLADRLHGVVKYTEKRLRDEVKFKHRLRSYEITKTDAAIVDRLIAEQLPAYLKRFGPAKTGGKPTPPAPEPVVVTVNSEDVRRLMAESEEVRGRLIGDMGSGVSAKPVETAPIAERLEARVEPVAGFDATQVAALRAMLRTEGVATELRRIAEGAGMLVEVLIDGINEAGVDVFRDTIVDRGDPTPRIHEDYVEDVRALVGG